MKQWHFNVLFALAVVGAVTMLFADRLGLTVRPEVVGVFGLIMAFVLQQKDSLKKDAEKEAEAKAEAVAEAEAKVLRETPGSVTYPPPVEQPDVPAPPGVTLDMLTPEMLAALKALSEPKVGEAPTDPPAPAAPATPEEK